MRATLAALLVAVAVPGLARAQPVSEASGPDTYLQVHLGAFVPGGDLDRFDTGYSVGGTFGARFSRHLAVEASVAYEAARAGSGASPRFSDVPISVSLAARLPFKRAELAVYGGPDLHMARLDPGPGAAWTDTAFGGHLGARAAFNLWPTILVGLDLRATMATAQLGGADVAIDGVRVAVTLQHRFQ